MPDNPYQISQILQRLVHSYASADELFAAVRKVHPLQKKDIVLAALGVMIDQAETDQAATKTLHRLAMDRRGAN